MRRDAETAFLPAALEIQHTPPAPAGRAILWTVLTLFVFSLVWATLGDVDIVSVAQGRIIPRGHSKTVQPLEIGTVTAIHVGEGQAVKAGEVLLQLDSSSVDADVARLEVELRSANRDVRRLKQLSVWLEMAKPPSTGESPVYDDLLLWSQWHEFEDRLAVLRRDRERQLVEQQSAQQQVDKLQAILPIVSRRARDQKGLAAQQLLPEQKYLETEQARLEIFHDLRTRKGRVAELAAGVAGLEARIEFTSSEFHRQVLEKLEEAGRGRAAAAQELIKAKARAKAKTITASVDGVIQQLEVHSVGAVVTPAQELMVIVPEDGSLEVEAILENKDIGFVEVGQQTEIKIDTFPFTRYGTIAGRVVDLSNDAVADEHGGLVYKMRVAMDHSEISVNGNQVRLSPGMSVSVESKTGTRKVIEFFLSPLLRYADESVRER